MIEMQDVFQIEYAIISHEWHNKTQLYYMTTAKHFIEIRLFAVINYIDFYPSQDIDRIKQDHRFR